MREKSFSHSPKERTASQELVIWASCSDHHLHVVVPLPFPHAECEFVFAETYISVKIFLKLQLFDEIQIFPSFILLCSIDMRWRCFQISPSCGPCFKMVASPLHLADT